MFPRTVLSALKKFWSQPPPSNVGKVHCGSLDVDPLMTPRVVG